METSHKGKATLIRLWSAHLSSAAVLMRAVVWRPVNLAILATYLLLSVPPFVPLLFGKTITHPLRILVIELAAWLTVIALMKRPANFHWLLIPAFFAWPVEIYLHAHYHQGFTVHHLGMIAESSPSEASEFLGQRVWVLLGLTIGVGLWWALVWRIAKKTRDFDMPLKPRLLALGLLSMLLCLWLYGWGIGVEAAKEPEKVTFTASSATASGDSDSEAKEDDEDEDEDDEDDEEDADDAGSGSGADKADPETRRPWADFPKLPAWAALDFGKEQFSQSWPFGLWVIAYDYWKERTLLAELSGMSSEFKFGASPDSKNQEPQVLVLVIGESSRYDRWSLNGYSRETNPLLQVETNLVTLSNVIAPISATRLVVPLLLTRKPAIQSLSPGFSEKSIVSAYKEAGFKTYWLSNQLSYGKFDTPVSAFAKEAQVTQFLNLGGFTNNSTLDQVLLAPLRDALADPAPKKLIVLHTIGNHWNYSYRHSPEFEKWKPSLSRIDKPNFTDLKLREEINNSYDNSILYADWFLAKTIAELKASAPPISTLFFISDHGENLFDGKCDLVLHGSNTKYDFHVPAFVWYSDAYRQAFTEKITQLQKHRHAPLSSENVFHSMADMGGIKYSGERLERSLFSKALKHHTRYVESNGWTDYDNASLDGDCSKVKANSKKNLHNAR